MEQERKRILVAGAAGFIGSHLCERLLAASGEVIGADNFYTGSARNISHLSDNTRFRIVEHDVTRSLFVPVDQIYNLACPASPIHYANDPIYTTKTNVLGTLNLLGLATRLGAKILQASTSEVYGDPEMHPQPESYWGRVNPIGPRSCYDEGKRCAESLCVDYHRQHRVRVKLARIFNVYGPRMLPQDGRVVSNFILQSLKGEPVTVYGDGSHTRSFCYVDDLVEGLLKLMSSDDAVLGPINLGNPEEIGMLDLARKILDLTGSSARIVFMPLPQDDPKQRRPDISQAQATLGWTPTCRLDEGLRRTIAYFDELLSAGRTPAALGVSRWDGYQEPQRLGA